MLCSLAKIRTLDHSIKYH